MLAAGVDPRDHDPADHLVGLARGAARRAARAARRRARARRDALGGRSATRVLPYARSGIIGAVILGLGRALGETMAVTMVIGNSAEIHASLFAPATRWPASSPTSSPKPPAIVHLASLTALGARALRGHAAAQRRRAAAGVARGAPVPRGRAMNERGYAPTERSSTRAVSTLALAAPPVVLALLPLLSVRLLLPGRARARGAEPGASSPQLPKPVGETGGGMANAHRRHARAGGDRLRHRHAGRLGAGVYLAESRRAASRRGALLRRRDGRRAVDRHRHLRLHGGRAADAPLLARSPAASRSRSYDADRHAHDRRSCCAWCPARCAKAALALGVPRGGRSWRRAPHRAARHRHRRAARGRPRRAARRRRCCSPRSTTDSGQRASTQPIASLPVQILHLRHHPVRGLAPAGLGAASSSCS